jgi:hypothetical protein
VSGALLLFFEGCQLDGVRVNAQHLLNSGCNRKLGEGEIGLQQ